MVGLLDVNVLAALLVPEHQHRAFEVEFATLDGGTAAVATVETSQVRPVTSSEITHARQLATP